MFEVRQSFYSKLLHNYAKNYVYNIDIVNMEINISTSDMVLKSIIFY